ncbi:MAG: hypothetical protein HYR49_02330 [Gammaproteobacteria bacterium]|nr:hypothetical protein [Gammaproteobacteria bacterium]
MKITLRLLGNLRQYLPVGREFSDIERDFADATAPADLPLQVGIPAGTPLMFVLNDTRLTTEQAAHTQLAHGDLLIISPAVKGG